MITVTPEYLDGLNVNALENSYLYDVPAADDNNVAIIQCRKMLYIRDINVEANFTMPSWQYQQGSEINLLTLIPQIFVVALSLHRAHTRGHSNSA